MGWGWGWWMTGRKGSVACSGLCLWAALVSTASGHFHGSLQRPLGSWTGLQGRVPRPLSADWLAQDFKLWSQHPSIFEVSRAKVHYNPPWPPGFKGCAKLSEQVSALAEPTRTYQPALDLNSHPELPLACAYFLLQAGNYMEARWAKEL